MPSTRRRGWRETVEPGLYRAHRVACPSSEDRRTGRRCRCPWQFQAPAATAGRSRTVTVYGSLSEVKATRRATLAAGRPEPPVELVAGTFHDLAAAYFRVKGATLAPATVQTHDESYWLRLHAALGHLDVADLTRARLEAWLAELIATARSQHMVRKTLATLRVILATGAEWGWLAGNPAAGLRAPRPGPGADGAVKRVLTSNQLSALFAAASPNPRIESMLRAAGEVGLRRGEAIGLRWPDLDLVARRVTVERSVWQERRPPGRKIVKLPKGGRPRRVAISSGLIASLERWRAISLAKGADPEGYVWPGRDGGLMGADSPGQALARVQVRAGLVDGDGSPLVTFHGLRHTCASIMLARGVPLLVVSRQLGHRSPQVTADVYAHLLADTQLDDAMRAFD